MSKNISLGHRLWQKASNLVAETCLPKSPECCPESSGFHVLPSNCTGHSLEGPDSTPTVTAPAQLLPQEGGELSSSGLVAHYHKGNASVPNLCFNWVSSAAG